MSVVLPAMNINGMYGTSKQTLLVILEAENGGVVLVLLLVCLRIVVYMSLFYIKNLQRATFCRKVKHLLF